MSKSKRRRKAKKTRTAYELSGALNVHIIDGVNCVKQADLERSAYGATLSMGLQGEQAVETAAIILFHLFDRVAVDGLCLYNEQKDTLIEIGPGTDAEGMPQASTWIEHQRVVEWPAEIDTEKGLAK
ncbi:MAG: hypothetical protein ACREEM_24785 [Blastocatellia bacterium]